MEYFATIKRLASARGITIQKLEQICNIGSGTIARWDNSEPRADSLYRVSQQLNVPIEWLLNGIPAHANLNDAFNDKADPVLTEEEQLLFKCFNASDFMGRAKIIQVCLNEYDRCSK